MSETLKSQNLIPKVAPNKIANTYIDAKQQNLFETNNFNKKISPVKTEQKDSVVKENTPTWNMPISNLVKPEQNIVKETPKVEKKEIEKEQTKKSFVSYKIVGQVFGTYWIIQQNDSVFLIDQHAAHERILYEKFINLYKSKSFTSQMLLQPLVVKITPKENQILIDNLDLFATIGFQIEKFGDNDYIIRAVPVIFDNPENVNFFNEILDELNTRVSNSPLELKFDKIARISCKAAVKAHNKLTEVEVKKLIDDLMNLENPFNCPHGRPTIVEINKHDIEKIFKRT